ncbi:MAG TPA: hypothetical protein VHY09_07390 [Candidatus Methylacidiphilales bacterium]|nr:hypothetical protein [Candidatus Methylacidiphilales bacterium]
MASAQTVYHLTGSTAFRNAVMAGEVAICGGNSAYAIYWGSSSNNLSNANYSIVATGTTTSDTVFENFWNGSIAGDQALTEPVSLNFPDFTTYASSMTHAAAADVPSLTQVSGGTQVTNTSYTGVSHVPELALSDAFFSTAQQIMKAASPADNNTPSGGTSATNTEIGIIPFVFIADGSPDVYSKLGTPGVAPATVALSMDPQKYTYVWSSGGSAPLSLFTGSTTDTLTPVYGLGRDADSGTRATTLSETGYGLNGSGKLLTPVAQFYPYSSNSAYTADEATATADSTGVAGFHATTGVCGIDSTATSIEQLDLVPFESVDGYDMGSPGNDGDGGYYSGGNNAVGISTPFASSTANTVMMTSLGCSDAKTALTGVNPACLMAYNGVIFYPTPTLPSGVTLASNAAQIYTGKYTFWGYEHMYYLSTASGEATTLRTTLKTDLYDELASNGVAFANMLVTRSSDGANVQ